MRDQLSYRTREASPPSRASSRQTLLLRVIGSEQVVNLDHDCTVGRRRQTRCPERSVRLARHCVVVRRDDSLWLQDEGSRNGTWVNSVRVERCSVAARGAHRGRADDAPPG